MYLPNLRNGLFWDDEDWIVNNPAVHALSWRNISYVFTHDALAGVGLVSNYYRPVLFLSFLGNYMISGTNPIGYHLVNNFVHIANAVLIFLLLFHLFKRKLPAFLASFFFLIHPLQTEAVTYVSGRGDPLSVFFMLGALTVWLYRPRWKYWTGIPLAILALLSRETAVLFPVYLVIVLMTFVYRDGFWRSLWQSIKNAWPFFAISLAYGILRLTVLNFQNTLNFYRLPNVYTEHLVYRLYTFLEVIVTYFKLILVPTGLHMERDVIVKTSLLQWPVWFAIFILIGIIAMIVWRWRRGDRIWFFAWGMFFIPLIPTSGIVPINGLIYEHWLYFSFLGVGILVAMYLEKLWEYLKRQPPPWLVVFSLSLLTYSFFLGVQTVKRNIIWGDPKALYENIVRYEPHNVRALSNLANLYLAAGDKTTALRYYRQAVSENDIQPQPYYNLANVLVDTGDTHGAIQWYLKAIEVDPSFPYAYQNLSALYAQQGRFDEALKYLIILAALQEQNPQVWYNIALVADAMGNATLASESIQKAHRLAELYRPDLLEPIVNLQKQLLNEPRKK